MNPFDLSFFMEMPRTKAAQFLNDFLADTPAKLQLFYNSDPKLGVADYSIESAADLLLKVGTELRKVPRPKHDIPDPCGGNYPVFDEYSIQSLTIAAYYLGEVVRRHASHLSWAVGAPRQRFQNVPSITGFPFDIELPTFNVAKVICGCINEGTDDRDAASRVVRGWIDQAQLPEK